MIKYLLESNQMQRLIRLILFFLALYLIGDGVIHLFNIRLNSVVGIWSNSAISYATLLNAIYASFVFLAAILILVVQFSLKKYKNLILASSIWALFHGLLLIYLTSTQNFLSNFSNLPSLYFWMPFYNQYLLFEAFLSFAYAILIFIWSKKVK